MREVGQRRQSLGIRLTLLEPIADLLDHLIKRVQSQMWQLLFAQFLAIDVPPQFSSGLLAQESRARWRAQGKAPRDLSGSLVWV